MSTNLQIKDKPSTEVNKPAESEPLIWPELTPVLIRILNRMWFKFWQASSKLGKGHKLSVLLLLSLMQKRSLSENPSQNQMEYYKGLGGKATLLALPLFAVYSALTRMNLLERS